MAAETWAALRQIMYQPSACWLATEYSGDRWLTDQFVLLDVTRYDEFEGVPDGPYQLVVSRGAVPGHPKSREAVPEPDIEAWFTSVNHRDWLPAEPTEWSVNESPSDRAMLWNAGGCPVLLGRETWTAISKHYPEVRVRHSFRGNSMFRFYTTYHLDPDDDCAGGDCPCEAVTFAYAAGIQIPDGQEDAANAVISALDTTSNHRIG